MQKLEAAASQLQQVGTQEALLSPLSNFPPDVTIQSSKLHHRQSCSWNRHREPNRNQIPFGDE